MVKDILLKDICEWSSIYPYSKIRTSFADKLLFLQNDLDITRPI